MDWQKLHYFLVVAQCGNLKMAASQLNINHTTIYRQLNDFEASLGFKLFHRHASGYILTEQGERMFRTAVSVNEQIKGLEYHLSNGTMQLSGTLRLWVQEDILNYFLIPNLKKCKERYPDLNFDIDSSGTVPDIASSKFDVILLTSHHDIRCAYAHKLFEVIYDYYASADYVREHGGVEEMQTSAKHCLIDYKGRLSFEPTRMKISNKILCDNISAQIALVEKGLGIGVLSNYLSYYHSDLIKIPNILSNDQENKDYMWFVGHSEYYKGPKIDSFKGFLIEQIAAQKIHQRAFLNLVE